MAATSMTGNRGALALGLAWALVLIAVGALALFIQLFGHPPAGEVVTGALPTANVAQKIAAKPVEAPPPPLVFETPPGGILPAQLSEAEAKVLAALAPPPPPPESQAGDPNAVAEAAAPPVALPPLKGGTNVANPAVLEKTPQGYMPRVAENGLTPMRAYAGAVPSSTRPKIAIVIGGLGLSARSTKAAIDHLPPGVTLAFAPYAADVQNWVTLARQRGHEVLLQVPMEPYDFPDSDPGQYTLRATAGDEANTKRLTWALTRFTGYVGVTNMMGGRFLSETGPLEPVMTFLSRRGLMFYDNGAASRSVAPVVAERLGAPFVQATNAIDSIQAAMEIDRRLADLETEARLKGKAVGSGIYYPVTVERVTLWARGLQGRGFVLAPISAIVGPAKK